MKSKLEVGKGLVDAGVAQDPVLAKMSEIARAIGGRPGSATWDMETVRSNLAASLKLYDESLDEVDGLTPSGYEEKVAKLRGKLLALGGEGPYCLGRDPDIDRIIAHGQVFTCEGRLFVRGRRNRCHTNAASLYLKKRFREAHLVVGYGLTPYGKWTSHTWLAKDGQVIETNPNPAKYKTAPQKYFGCVLTDIEALAFVWRNDEIWREEVEKKAAAKKPGARG
jgi:hypothetical protein